MNEWIHAGFQCLILLSLIPNHTQFDIKLKQNQSSPSVPLHNAGKDARNNSTGFLLHPLCGIGAYLRVENGWMRKSGEWVPASITQLWKTNKSKLCPNPAAQGSPYQPRESERERGLLHFHSLWLSIYSISVQVKSLHSTLIFCSHQTISSIPTLALGNAIPCVITNIQPQKCWISLTFYIFCAGGGWCEDGQSLLRCGPTTSNSTSISSG